MALIRNIKPFKVLGPGDHLKEFMEIFNWTQEDLASVMGISAKHLNSIVKNKQPITLEIAKLLSKTFGHSPQFWINLDTEYRLKISENSKEDHSVEIKTMLYKYMPINEMFKRQWIPKIKDAQKLFEHICSFWNVQDLNENFFKQKADFFALRKSDSFDKFNLYYALTWLQMAKNISKSINVLNYDSSHLKELSEKIHTYTIIENGVELFLNELEEIGIKFVFLKHLPKTYLDGATFFDSNNPVIVHTGRYNRIDHFWFTISHEIGHILKHLENSESVFIDDEKLKDKRSKIEKEADEFAVKVLKQKEIIAFFSNNMNYITTQQIYECSEALQIHQGVIIGALAFQKTISYSHLHKFTEEINDKIPERFFAWGEK